MRGYPKNLAAIQKVLHAFKIDGWLFYDFNNRDQIAYRVLDLDQNKLTTRRWYYFIPTDGVPLKLVHKVEKGRLSELPGNMIVYSSWKELHRELAKMLKDCRKVAMQYSPYNNIPDIAYVDAGTIELVRSFNVEVVSSANLIQLFTARIDEEGVIFHKEAGRKIQRIKDMVFELIFNAVKSNKRITEYDAQQFILEQFMKENLTCEALNPIVAVNSHAADPHFEVNPNNAYEIKWRDRILVDLWAKVNVPTGIYYDITWCGYLGETPPKEYVAMFDVVVKTRNITKNFIVEKLKKGKRIFGWQVDDVCREYISTKGYGDYFIHRTGHSIDTKVHGSGVNLDNFETKDEREILSGVCFSIEPGIYKNDIGARSEINILVDNKKNVVVVGKEQEELILLV